MYHKWNVNIVSSKFCGILIMLVILMLLSLFLELSEKTNLNYLRCDSLLFQIKLEGKKML